MSLLFPLAVLAITNFVVANCQVQFPCDHILHNFPGLSRYFEHCQCRYGDWGDVVPLAHVQLIPVPRNEFKSGMKNSTGARYQHGELCDNPGCDVCPLKQEVVFGCVSACRYVNATNFTHVDQCKCHRISVKVSVHQYQLAVSRGCLWL